MEICRYQEQYRQQIIDLILHIQNEEAGIALSIEEQPDLLDIPLFYEKNGGGFWIAVENNEVIGTFAFMNYGNGNAVLKKFFVRADWRNKKIGLALYETVISYLKENNYKQALLDTPAVAKTSHRFYEKAGFKRITNEQIPFQYEYPDRNSYLYLLKL
ncbi:MAG: GNAT family N-acetyltransferase [Eubacterium sp.]|nr:GNAT family N-acetyltransferase [Eubacterium sp.]MCC8161126.1 GNAT family N-acetyltransferase [Oscillospiraceae bacterium]